jgi:putative DNA primase/helicase
MTSRLEEQAEREARDLARMESARGEKRTRKTKPASTNSPRARFDNIDGEAAAPGVYWIGTREDRDGATVEAAPQWICSPMSVVAYTRDASGGEWGRLLVFRDRDGTQHRVSVAMAMLAGNGEELRAVLLAQGLEITSHTERRRKLGEYIAQATPEKKARCVSRSGWHGAAFVTPAETFGNAGGEEVILQTASVDGAALTRSGTMAGWREQVAAPCAGNSRLVLAVSAAFAAPCLALLDGEGGGLHFRGSSSSGKTTALAVAASVYGPQAFMRTWRSTDNALESVAALYSDMLLPLDEIGQLEPRAAGGAAYMLSNGAGKSRSHRDGSARAATRFRVLFLSAGEIGLADLVREGGGKARAGHEVRVLDVPAEPEGAAGVFERVPDDCSPGEFADRLKRAATENHGHALPAWLGYLTSDPDGIRGKLRARRDEIADMIASGNVNGQVRRVALRFAIIAAAGEMASTSAVLTGWQPGEATRAARACFEAWKRARGTDGAAEPAAMVAQVREFIERNGEARFSQWHQTDADHKPRTINRAGYRKADDDNGGHVYYILPEVFRADVCAGFDHRIVARTLRDVRALKCEASGGFTRAERIPAEGRKVRVYVIDPRPFDGADDAEPAAA